MTEARAVITPFILAMIRRANKGTGDGVGNARDCFTPEVRPKEYARQTTSSMTEARAPTTLLCSAAMRPANKGNGNGARIVRECFTPVV